MKKYLFLAAAALMALAACTSEDLVDKEIAGNKTTNPDNVMGFSVHNKNLSRAGLETVCKNFGVFAYKTPASGPVQTVMNNYLVGYHSQAPLAAAGYALNGQSTWGQSDNLYDATSLWIYEKLGNAEYDYTGSEGYYKKTETAYMSNNAKQYLKYWDYSSSQVEFFAYAPYVKADAEATPPVKAVEFDYDSKTLTVYNTDLVTMVAKGQAVKLSGDYKKDVSLTFTSLGAIVKLKFWDDVPGYDVEMIDYTLAGKTGVVAQGVITRTGGNYVYNFSSGTGSFSGTKDKASRTLEFAIPTGGEVTNVPANSIATGQPQYYKIGETSETASASATDYLAQEVDASAVPKENGDLTFHVSFRLHSLDTNETITVNNATVVVPASYTQWQKNTVYTYKFCITKDANGYTGLETDPAGLYPIVFDQVNVADLTPGGDNFVISATTVTMKPATDLEITGTSASVSAEIENLDAGSNKVMFTSTFVEVASFDAPGNDASYETTCTGSPLTASATVYNQHAGTTVINAWCNGVKSAGRLVKVPLKIDNTELTIAKGSTATLSATNIPTGATVSWATSDATKATVDADGKVTAVAETATDPATPVVITATYTDARGVNLTATCEVTVTP